MSVDVSSGSEVVTFYVEATDETGVDWSNWSDTNVTLSLESGGYRYARPSTSNPGVFELEVTPEDPSGEWEILWLRITDTNGNQILYRTASLIEKGLESETLTVLGGTEADPPVLVSISLDKVSVDVSSGSEVVTFYVEATDETGVDWSNGSDTNVTLSLESGGYRYARPSTSNPGVFELEVTPEDPSGEWEILWLRITDTNGNQILYRTDELKEKGLVNGRLYVFDESTEVSELSVHRRDEIVAIVEKDDPLGPDAVLGFSIKNDGEAIAENVTFSGSSSGFVFTGFDFDRLSSACGLEIRDWSSSFACKLTELEPLQELAIDVSISSHEPGPAYARFTLLSDLPEKSFSDNFLELSIQVLSPEGDADSDGVANKDDAFPLDSAEYLDTDSDGLGNEADADDDDDGLPDDYERANDFDYLDSSDALEDRDGDGYSNLEEYLQNTDPSDPKSGGDSCPLESGAESSESMLPFETHLYFINPASNARQQTFLRLSNPHPDETEIEIYGVDDLGKPSRGGPMRVTLAPMASLQLTAQDLEDGNISKGLEKGLCDGDGKWWLSIRSANQINAMGLIRTPDGFLTNMTEAVPKVGNRHYVYFLNPASNKKQQSFLRLINLSSETNTVQMEGVDDLGQAGISSLSIDLQANESVQLTAQDLEAGSPDKGLKGSLGNGEGKWRLEISSENEMAAMSLIRSSDGFLTNLSSVVQKASSGKHEFHYLIPSSDLTKQSFIRFINLSDDDGTVTIQGILDDGGLVSGGDVQFTLLARQAKQINSLDLEVGNLGKGLLGAMGTVSDIWRLSIDSDIEMVAMSLVRTNDGFLTSLSSIALTENFVNNVQFMNPARNVAQESFLRVVNLSDQVANLSIVGTDDSGKSGQGTIALSLLPKESRILTARELEKGNAETGIVGALGSGVGKWRLSINSDVEIVVQSLLQTPGGFITNLSSSSSDESL